MSPKASPTPGRTMLSPQDHALILIDFQSQMAFATRSLDSVLLRNNAALVARAAAGFKVRSILTTVAEKSFSGPMFAEITEAFPRQSLIDRTTMNTWEDAAVIRQVPVFILHLYDRALLNAAALRAVGYTKDTPEPPGMATGTQR